MHFRVQLQHRLEMGGVQYLPVEEDVVDRVRLDPDLPVGAHAVRAGQVELERVERAAQGLRQDAVARRVGQPLEVVVAHQAARGVQEVLREARRAQPGLVVGLLLSVVER